METPRGVVRLLIWDGIRDYINEPPPDLARYLPGIDTIFIAQVSTPVGVNGRSALALSKTLAEITSSIIHWARDTPTWLSIVGELTVAGLANEDLALTHQPIPKREVIILASNG